MSVQMIVPRLFASAGRSRWARPAASAIAHAALLVVLGCAVLIAVAAAAGDSFLVSTPSGHAPAWLTGPLGGLGSSIGRPEFLRLVALMWIGYALAVAACDHVSPVLALSVVAALHVVFFAAPPLMSTDVFGYLDYARLGSLHGLNPYTHPPIASPGDAVYPLVGEKWRHTATAYGPLFTLITYPLAHLPAAAAIWALKGLATTASLACVVLVWHCARRRGRDGLRPALLVGLNPLLLVFAVGGGHNDLIMMAATVGAVALVLAERERSAAVSACAAAAIKASAVVVLPFVILGARRPRRALVGAAAGLAATFAISALAFDGQAWRVVDVLREQQSLVGAESFPHQIARLFGIEHTVPVMTIAHTALAVTALALLAAVRRGADWIAAAGWLLLMLVVTTSFLMPWYTIWALPLAAISADRRLLTATLFIEALFFAHQLGPLLAH
jgi:alpha-1,6-mannosyltransferase